jgi:S1-C subfamily serine protease
MTDAFKNDYMLFSAIARPGNSGGPIVSEKGRVLGLVSKEVKFDGTSTFPFFAAVPAEVIAKALLELSCPVELPIDTFE